MGCGAYSVCVYRGESSRAMSFYASALRLVRYYILYSETRGFIYDLELFVVAVCKEDCFEFLCALV